jgi:hypothetical protein
MFVTMSDLRGLGQTAQPLTQADVGSNSDLGVAVSAAASDISMNDGQSFNSDASGILSAVSALIVRSQANNQTNASKILAAIATAAQTAMGLASTGPLQNAGGLIGSIGTTGGLLDQLSQSLPAPAAPAGPTTPPTAAGYNPYLVGGVLAAAAAVIGGIIYFSHAD